MTKIPRLLVVEDDARLATALAAALRPWADQLLVAATLDEARAQLDPPPRLVLIDFALPDGDAPTLIAGFAALRPLPAVIAMSGTANSQQAFALAQSGACAYLAKPFDLKALELAWDEALCAAPDVAAWARRAVGKVPLRTVEQQVRDSMLDEALALSMGSRRRAARFLDVSRQLLQHMLRK